VLCLQLLRGLEGTSLSVSWTYRLTHMAVLALSALGRLEFLPLQLTLLDALFATEISADDKADLLLRRGNTRAVLAQEAPAMLDSAVQDLEAAAELARARGLAHVELEAECSLVRTAFLELPGQRHPLPDELSPHIARLEAMLPRAEPLAMASDVHDLLSDLEMRSSEHGRTGASARAIHHARRAAALSPSPVLKAARLASLAQVLLKHGTSEEKAEALQVAQEAVKLLPADAGDLHSPLPHAALGNALLHQGRASEAIPHLEYALQLMARQRPSAQRNRIRIHLAKALLDASRPDDARQHLELTSGEAHTSGDGRGLRSATWILVQLDRENRREDDAQRRLLEAEARLSGTPAATLLALTRLEPKAHEVPSAGFIALVRDYLSGQLPTAEDSRIALECAVTNHAHQLPPDIRRALLEEGGGIIQNPLVRAQFLVAEGRQEEALDTLRGMLDSSSLEPARRLRAAAMLIALLPENAHEERLRWCEEVEKELNGPRDDPHTRTVLARALWQSGRNDRGLLERAWRHVQRAEQHPGVAPETRMFTSKVGAWIRLDQLSLLASELSPIPLDFAAWFTQDLPLPGEEVNGYRCHIVRCLLSPGPLTHPDALALAERLLGLVTPPTERARLLRIRLQWLRDRQAAPYAPLPPSEPLPRKLHAPADAMPGWAVALAHGQSPQLGRTPGREERGAAQTVIQLRPDRTEDVLVWLFSLESDSRGIDALADEVARSSPDASLRSLLDSVEKLAAERPSYRILRLRVALQRHRASVGYTASYTQAVDALLASARTAQERVGAKLLKGIERMEVERFEEARVLLMEALEEARSARLESWQLFPVLVSAGNAWRLGTAPEIDRSLVLYDEAERLGNLSEEMHAQLWKVKANALLVRGRDGDSVQALALLERSLGVRKSGFLRVETLLATAEAEQQQLGREELHRLRRALDRLDEAERHAQGHYQLAVAQEQVHVLAQLVRLLPKDGSLQQRLENLGQRHPRLAEQIKYARRGQPGAFTKDMVDAMGTMVFHPAGNAFNEAIAPLNALQVDMRMVERMAENLARARGVDSAEALQHIEQSLQKEDRSAQGLRARADRLTQVDDAQARPGAAVGRAVLLAHISEMGLATREEVEHAAHEAERLVREILEEEVRLRLLLELARVWAPDGHSNCPVRDYRRGAELAREVREASRPGEELSRMALQTLARATRYHPDGELQANLREAERLYEQCIQEYEASGQQDSATHIRTNLADLRIAQGAANTAEDLKDGMVAARARLADEGSPAQQATSRLSLAVYLTQSASGLPPAAARAALAEARTLFQSIERSLLPAAAVHSAENYQTICLAELACHEDNHAEAIRLWRQRLASLGPNTPEEVRAYTLHNLADMLVRDPRQPLLVMEGLDLSELSLRFRTLERNAGHHWETCDNIGQAIARLLRSPTARMWPATLAQPLWERGRRALNDALTAARRLGSHERLMKSSSALFKLALVAPSVSALEAVAAEGWSGVDEARPYLLLDEHTGAMEARLAAAVAEALSFRLSEQGRGSDTPGLGFVLSGTRAEPVLRWLVRAAGSAQRRLASRTARPESVPHGTWVEWLTASGTRDARTLGRALDVVRQHMPLFLRGEPDLEGTWNWLRARPDSAVVAVVQGSQGMMAVILTHEAQRQVLIAHLDTGSPPHDEATVARGLSARGPGDEYRALLEWTRRTVLGPLGHLLPRTLSQLLWVPTGVLRMLAPADLWPSVPVTCAVRLDLETRPAPPRPRRTLLAVADPGPGSPRSIPNSIELMASLAPSALEQGDLRVRMSRGAAWGRMLGIPCPELVEGPASPDELLRELDGVDVALLLCHGEVDGPRDARLLLLDGSGAEAPLSMQRLADEPRRVAGATIVLLSCETGRVGDWLHQAAGLAGTLLAGGARNVIAPLWPVLLDPAWAVGRAVLEALSSREDLSVVLRRLSAPESGPALGGPARVRREQELAWSLRAFVRWVG
jgi:tetratricopeptide (TPR) repeat protein